MAIPSSKDELINAINSSYSKLKKELYELPTDMLNKPIMKGHCKGSKMSVCNLISYLIGWGELVLKWDNIYNSGVMPDIPETGFKMNKLGELAIKFYKDYEDKDFKALMWILDKTAQDILCMVRNKTNEQLYKKLWYKNYTFGRMVQLNTSSPYKNALIRVRGLKKEICSN